MKRAAASLFLVLPLLAAGSGQQPGSSVADPLVITDKDAVAEWSRSSQGQQPLDPKAPADTQFLLSLSETERTGALLYKQRCIVCHGRQMSLLPNTWGPLLSRVNVEGREEAVRRQIIEGSNRMPAFKYALQPSDIEAMIAYMKKLENP